MLGMCRQQSTHKFDIWIFYLSVVAHFLPFLLLIQAQFFVWQLIKSSRTCKAAIGQLTAFCEQEHMTSMHQAMQKEKEKKRFSSSVWVELNCALFLTIFMSSIDWLLHRRLSNHYTHQLALTDLRKNGLRIKKQCCCLKIKTSTDREWGEL